MENYAGEYQMKKDEELFDYLLSKTDFKTAMAVYRKLAPMMNDFDLETLKKKADKSLMVRQMLKHIRR